MKPLARLALLFAAVLAGLTLATPAWAGAPHFVDSTITATRSGDTLTVSGKEAGLGDEAQIHVVVTATAQCINPGGNHPKAVNKEDLTAAADFPVQNGHADWSLDLVAVFQPSCSPPMTVVFSDVVVTDETNGLVASLPGTF
jgi:hypothetical protein